MAMTHSEGYYHSLLSAYSGRIALSEVGELARPMTKGWPNAPTIPFRDAYGRDHLVTEKQYAIYMWALGKLAMLDTTIRMRDVADQLHVSVSTVSNTLRKLMAWGMLAYWSYRGRYGKTVLWQRSKGDGLERFADFARAKISAMWARIRAHSNVRTGVDRDRGSIETGSIDRRTYLLSSSPNIRMRQRDDRIEAHLMSMQGSGMRRVPCPAHEGQDRNLAFWRRPDGSLGVKCWSHQCDSKAIKDAIEPWQ